MNFSWKLLWVFWLKILVYKILRFSNQDLIMAIIYLQVDCILIYKFLFMISSSMFWVQWHLSECSFSISESNKISSSSLYKVMQVLLSQVSMIMFRMSLRILLTWILVDIILFFFLSSKLALLSSSVKMIFSTLISFPKSSWIRFTLIFADLFENYSLLLGIENHNYWI